MTDEVIFLVQKNRHGRIKFIHLYLRDSRIGRRWGLIDGTVQTNFHEYEAINKGKANELSSSMAARVDFNRVIKEKTKEGYLLVDSLDDLPDMDIDPLDNLDFDDIDTAFCCSKPTQKITPKAIDKVIEKGNAKFFVKYNGGCHYFVVNGSGEIRLFTRRWADHTSKYPTVVADIKAHSFPIETIGIVELCIDPLLNRDHMWAFKQYAKIAKAGTLKGVCKENQLAAISLQKQNPIKAAVFALLYHKGEQVWHWPYKDVWALVQYYIEPLSEGNVLFQPQEVIIKTGKAAFSIAKQYKKKIEGFVMWDMTKSLEITMNGKPLRRAAWKIKAYGEMDVIAYDGEFGKKEGLYGSLKICRMGSDMEQVDMGTVGGLKHKEGEADPSYWKFPCVIEITYDNIFPDTGLPQFGSFSKIHEDKLPEEVPLFSLEQ